VHTARARLLAAPWGLFAVLTGQGFLSARLMHLNSAFLDEATYIYAGHQQWNHWLHGAPIDQYQTYFSGAPVLYPPLAAVADSLGGLTGARILSLVFMLGATTLLYASARLLYGTLTATLAAAFFVSLGSTQFLGAFATYDAMAIFLLAVAATCAIHAAKRPESTRLWLLGAVAMTLANATKYSSILWDPIVITLAGLCAYKALGLKAAVRRSAGFAAVSLALSGILLALGGALYVVGINYTTFQRADGTETAMQVLGDAWDWIGVLIAVAAIGVIAAGRDRVNRIVLAVLLFAGLLAPLNQARIHTSISLQKHVDFGAWFMAVAAAYGAAWLWRVLKDRRAARWAAAVVAAGAVALVFDASASYAEVFYANWPNSARLDTALAPLIHPGGGQYLAEDPDVIEYYMGDRATWQQWDDTWYFTYTDPATGERLSGRTAMLTAIREGYFRLIILDFGATPALDHQIVGALDASGRYRYLEDEPYDGRERGQYTIWTLEGSAS
jgi:hypothetical protein